MHAPRHAHLHTHTCRHAWSLDPEGTCPRVAGLPGSPGQTLAPACAQLPLPPLASCPVCTGKGFLPARAEMRWEPDRWGHCVLRGLSRLPLKKSKAKKKKKKRLYCQAAQSRAPGKEAFPKDRRSVFKRENSSKDSRQVPCAASVSCTRFLYSIFLASLRPCVLRGGSDPASQGLVRLSPSPKCALCPMSGPTPTTTTSISLVAHGVP